eukprot:m.311335 g.311335  ORF g.311335 m.311335 type:complete len:77 (+) comp65524_c0_seq1:1104-1334(+)
MKGPARLAFVLFYLFSIVSFLVVDTATVPDWKKCSGCAYGESSLSVLSVLLALESAKCLASCLSVYSSPISLAPAA